MFEIKIWIQETKFLSKYGFRKQNFVKIITKYGTFRSLKKFALNENIFHTFLFTFEFLSLITIG